MSFKNHGQSRRFIYDQLIGGEKLRNQALKSVDPEAHAHKMEFYILSFGKPILFRIGKNITF